MFETFARWLWRKAAPESTRSTILRPGQPTWSEWSYETYAREAFQGNPYVFRALLKIAAGCAGVAVAPMRALQNARGAEYVEVKPGDPVVNLVQYPSPLYAWPEWVERMLLTYLISGHCHAIAVGPDTGPNAGIPRELHWVRPDVMRAIPGSALGELLGFEYQSAAGKRRLDARDVFWMHSFSPLDEMDGLPVIAPAGRAVDTNNEALKWNKALLENGGVPGVALETAAEVSDTEAEDLLRQFSLRHGGGSNAGRPFLASGGLKVNTIGMTPAEGSWPETIGLTARQIALACDVPPEILGDGSQKTFSNYREARAALYTETILPLLDRFLGALSLFLRRSGLGDDLVLRYDRDDIEALKAEQTAAWDRIAAADFLMVNEKRAALGYPPVAGGNVILVRSGALPLDAVTGEPDAQESV